MKKKNQPPEDANSLTPAIIIVVAVVLFAVGWYFVDKQLGTTGLFSSSQQTNLPTASPLAPADEFHLPPGWVEQPAEGVELRFEREKTVSAIPPTIVLVKAPAQGTDVKKYVNNLIQGAKSAFTTLTITGDKNTMQNGIYERDLVGYYYNGKNKVVLKMNVYVKDGVTYTLTSSRDSKDTDLDKDIDSIFTSVYNARIK